MYLLIIKSMRATTTIQRSKKSAWEKYFSCHHPIHRSLNYQETTPQLSPSSMISFFICPEQSMEYVLHHFSILRAIFISISPLYSHHNTIYWPPSQHQFYRFIYIFSLRHMSTSILLMSSYYSKLILLHWSTSRIFSLPHHYHIDAFWNKKCSILKELIMIP